MSQPKLYNRHHRDVPKDAIYIGRGTPWGNPFPKTPERTRQQAVQEFEDYAERLPGFKAMVRRHLKGRHLVCSCTPLACHGDWLLRVASEENTPEDLKQELDELRRIKSSLVNSLNAKHHGPDFCTSTSPSLDADIFVSRFHAHVPMTDLRLLPLHSPSSTERVLIDALETAVGDAIRLLPLLWISCSWKQMRTEPSLNYLIAAAATIAETSMTARIHEVSDEVLQQADSVQPVCNLLKEDLLVCLQKLLMDDILADVVLRMREAKSTPYRVRVSIGSYNAGDDTRFVRVYIHSIDNFMMDGRPIDIDDVAQSLVDVQFNDAQRIEACLVRKENQLQSELDGEPPF